MKHKIRGWMVLASLLWTATSLSAQDAPSDRPRFFAYWGWNRDVYSTSDIRTTFDPSDGADQHFWFGEFDVLVGCAFDIGR